MCPPDWLTFQSLAPFYLSIRYFIFASHLSTDRFVPNMLLNPAQFSPKFFSHLCFQVGQTSRPTTESVLFALCGSIFSYAFGFLFSLLSSSTALELDVSGLGVLVLGRLGSCSLFWGTAANVLALNTKGSNIYFLLLHVLKRETRIVKTRIVKPTHVFWCTNSRQAPPCDCKSRDLFTLVIDK